jgi:L-ascorbate metabolism protein UlaG (beta-lactamase superfamily)
MKLIYHGHACVEVETAEHRLIIDPFLTGNPLADITPDQVKVDYILLTHAHGDHLGDTISIARQNNATVIATFELATWLGWQGLQVHEMGLGGSYDFPFGRVKFTVAHHSGAFIDEEKKEIIPLGNPAGILLTSGNQTLYHAGDTALFSDMKLIGMQHEIDVALLPIGDNFTMGPSDALIAAEWVAAKQVVPIHYNTFPPIKQDAGQFVFDLKQQKGITGVALQPGQAFQV